MNPEVIKASLVHTFLKQPRFCSLQVEDKTVKGGLKWFNLKEVNLDNYLIVPNLDINNIESPDKFVEDYVSNLSKTGIKMPLPMWDIHLLNLKTTGAESVTVFRVHHSLGDGISLMSLFVACTRKISNPNEPPTIPMVKKVNPSKSSEGFWGKFIKLWLAILLFWNTLVDVSMFIATSLSLLNDTKTPLKGPLSQSRRFVRRSTINDVMLAVTEAGLSRYLNRKYGVLVT
ncbi:O-acyltransferase WSD1-like [Pistacia vera]|uniref:O-acyltransferase WSD1-like n=1 Tax=Pistacia vera TaxID=55513 RepID=UPI0012639498|nr:O-acyltransferase WSD1-like [Pistacia vera]